MNPRVPMPVLAAACQRSRGLTLVEILIALVILSIGLLGLAGLQTASLKFNSSAYYRTQATALAYGMADRLRANRAAAFAGDYTVALAAPAPDCAAPNGAGSVPQQDISAWRMALACRLPLGNGSVASVGNEFTFTILWDDSHGKEAPMQFQFTTAL